MLWFCGAVRPVGLTWILGDDDMVFGYGSSKPANTRQGTNPSCTIYTYKDTGNTNESQHIFGPEYLEETLR